MTKLSFGEKLGYGSAAVGDAAVYTFICTFLLFFLTTVAGIQPAIAGTITVVASVWNAIFNPIIGYISDHSRSRFGRRRLYMLGFVIPLFFVTILLFTSIHITYGLRVIYYGFMTMAFWTCYTGFFVPFYALGAEYTSDYNERTVLRSYASFFNIIGCCLSMTAPTTIVKALIDTGRTETEAWAITAFIIAAFSLISILVTIIASKKIDAPGINAAAGELPVADELPPAGEESLEENPEEGRSAILKIFREYIEVLSLKPIRIALMVCVFYLIGYTIIMSDLMYFLTYNMGYSGMQNSMALLFRSLIAMLLLIPSAWLCKITDKRTALIITFLVGAAGISVMRMIHVEGVLTLGLLLIMTAVCTVFYWQIMPSIIYDICEYDEYETGKRREGAIVSIQGLVEAVAAGIGSQILGIILQIVGFDGDAAMQTPLVESWIFNCVTLVPAVLIVIAAFFMYRFPITRKVFEEIMQNLKERLPERKS